MQKDDYAPFFLLAYIKFHAVPFPTEAGAACTNGHCAVACETYTAK
jgi:hypothetical protein